MDNIRTNIFFLRFVGLWPDGKDSYKASLYTSYSIVTIICLMGSYNFLRVINIFFIYTNLEALTGTIYLVVTDLLVLVKIYFFIRNLKKLKSLVAHLDSGLFAPKNQTQIDLLRKAVNSWKTSYFCFWSLVVSTLGSWSVWPLFELPKKKRLPLESWYPYDIKVFPYYEITYVHQVISIWYLATANMNMDSFMAALMMFSGVQCDILCDDLRHSRRSKDFTNNLLKCITHHREIVRFAADSNSAYNLIILGQFFTSSLAIAMSMFQLTLVSPLTGDGISFLSYICAMTIQIFQYCWFGNEVEYKSAQKQRINPPEQNGRYDYVVPGYGKKITGKN